MEKKMDLVNQAALSRLGFGFGKGTVHSARTIMLDELTMLLEEVPAAQNKSDYIQAIIERNCLGKQSFNTRKRTAEHLTELYTLDPQVNLFRNLLYFWRREEQARPLLALLCAATRDGMLRETADRILKLAEGAKPALTDMEETIENLYPGRFSARSVTSMAQNLRATWTHTGHLTGRVIKIRQRVTPTPAAVTYALLLGYLQGMRGLSLFESEYVAMLDCSQEKALELAEQASARGWMIMKRVGNVVEAVFPQLINQEEAGWLRE